MSVVWILALALGAPLDRAFEDTPAELLAAAAIEAPDEAIDQLLVDRAIVFDELGRATVTLRRVYVIRSEGVIADWGRTDANWAPWYEERPEIRARVVSPDGEESWLLPEDLIEGMIGSDSRRMWVDDRTLGAPLPQVEVGSVIEEQITVREHRVRMEGGDSWYFRVPVAERFRLRIDAPSNLPVHYRTHRQDVAPKTRSRNARKQWVFDLQGLEEVHQDEPNAPLDRLGPPQISVGTGASWTELGSGKSLGVLG